VSEQVLRVLVVALCGVVGFVGVSVQRLENPWGLVGGAGRRGLPAWRWSSRKGICARAGPKHPAGRWRG